MEKKNKTLEKGNFRVSPGARSTWQVQAAILHASWWSLPGSDDVPRLVGSLWATAPDPGDLSAPSQPHQLFILQDFVMAKDLLWGQLVPFVA